MFILCPILKHLLFFIKDNHRQNTTSNKTLQNSRATRELLSILYSRLQKVLIRIFG